MNRILKLVGFSVIMFTSIINAQFSLEWSSSSTESYNTMGWLDFKKSGDTWESRFYKIDYNSFTIMTSEYSNTAQYTYNFSDSERDAGYLMYSLDHDLTGDGIVEFYVLGNYGDVDNPRQTMKVVDITTGNILFQKDDASNYYTYCVVWDADNDGILELSFGKYDYPSMENYSYQVYSTGVATSANSEPIHNLSFKLEIVSFSFKKSSFETFQPKAAEGKIAYLLLSAKFDAPSLLTVAVNKYLLSKP